MATPDTAYQKPETSQKKPHENVTFYCSLLKKISQNKQKTLRKTKQKTQNRTQTKPKTNKKPQQNQSQPLQSKPDQTK